MHRLAVVVDARAVVGVEQEHRGQRRDADGGEVGARIQHHLGVEHGLRAGPDGEAECRRRTRAVEQRVHDDRVAALRRPFQPERAKRRELLTGGIGGLDRETAGRQAVALVLRHSAEIARAEEGADLVEVVGAVERVVDAEAGESDVVARRLHLVEGEKVGAVANLHRAAVRHFEDVHALLVEKAAVKEFLGEFDPLSAPQRMARVEPDRAICLVIQVVQRVRQRGVRCLVGLLRQIARQVAHGCAIERLVGRWRIVRVRRPRVSKRRHDRQKRAPQQQLTTVHHASPGHYRGGFNA